MRGARSLQPSVRAALARALGGELVARAEREGPPVEVRSEEYERDLAALAQPEEKDPFDT
jgi:hypothetical protein